MNVGLIKYDAARRAITAASRVDEVKSIRDKAEAVRVYAKQAGDFAMQNLAAEIRLLAEHRAGHLLLDMTKNPGARGEGRPRKDGKIRRSSRSKAYPPKLTDLGISKDQSSKWQRMAQMMDAAAFERALNLAKEREEELTTAALLRAVKDVLKPEATVIADPNINLVATELIRDIESASRKEKLAAVVQLREQLNPTVRKKLILALWNARRDAASFEEQLFSGFQDFPNNGKAHQRIVREQMAEQSEPEIEEKRKLATNLKNASVREITYAEARSIVLGNEYLGEMNSSTEFSYGLFFGSHLAGVACFGSTAGSKVAASICGSEHRHRVITLCRGACVHWAHPHSASFLVSSACRAMTAKGYNVFVAYSDPAAGEIGTIYQAVNFFHCGPTQPTEQFRTPDGKIHDSRQVSGLARDRSGGILKYKRTRAEQKKILIEQGCEFFEGTPKHRYVGIFGDRRTKRILRDALKWPVLPYPKRQQPTDVTRQPDCHTTQKVDLWTPPLNPSKSSAPIVTAPYL